MSMLENVPLSQKTSTALPALFSLPGEHGGLGELMPYGSASSTKCARVRASLSTVSWLEMPASSVRKYRTPPATLIFESASAGAAVASSALVAPAAIRRDLGLTERQTLAAAQTFGGGRSEMLAP